MSLLESGERRYIKAIIIICTTWEAEGRACYTTESGTHREKLSCLRGEADVVNDHREIEGVGEGQGAGEVLQDLGAEKVGGVGIVCQ